MGVAIHIHLHQHSFAQQRNYYKRHQSKQTNLIDMILPPNPSKYLKQYEKKTQNHLDDVPDNTLLNF